MEQNVNLQVFKVVNSQYFTAVNLVNKKAKWMNISKLEPFSRQRKMFSVVKRSSLPPDAQ
jgi:hypothetical protein